MSNAMNITNTGNGAVSFDDVSLPNAMQWLDADTCRVAFERASGLVEQGYRKPLALRMGTILAREWADNGKSSERALPGPTVHVMHDLDGWIVCVEDDSTPTAVFHQLEPAAQRAHELATEYNSAVYVYGPGDALIDKYERYGPDVDGAYHVVPRDDGGWAVTRVGPDSTYEQFDTKHEAIAAARPLARDGETTLVIHYQDGDVQRTTNYQ